jgi:hypothetical protein
MSEGGSDAGVDATTLHRNPDAAPCGMTPACTPLQPTPCNSLTVCPALTHCGICANEMQGGVCAQACVPQGESGAYCTGNNACRDDLGLVCIGGFCVSQDGG